MIIDGLEKMLRQEVKLSNQQITFNEVRGHDDQYERGYRDALKMVIKNLAELPRGESIPVEWIEEWGWKNGMSESMSLRVMIEDWRNEQKAMDKPIREEQSGSD